MKIVTNIIRVLTGSLFIFSGLVKAIDPRGLAYKMQEFFEAWSHDGILPSLMNSLNEYALVFSVGMITLEVAVGAALLFGWQKKITTWILLLLILFFTFLTSYVLFSGKIRACGCFGDCIPITPVQTFTKDIILLLFVVFLMANRRYILPLAKPFLAGMYVLLITVATLLLQFYVLKHLPVVDCLPYKKGNNILKLREMPADAIPDKYDYMFVYEKNGEQKEFAVTGLPDSTWTFKERKQKLVQKGKNNIPLINDFSFSTASGIDTTAAILGREGTYYLLFIKGLNDYPSGWAGDIELADKLLKENKQLYIITAQRADVEKRFQKQLQSVATNAPIVLTCDGTAIKTAARANPSVFRMEGAVVQQKLSWADFGKLQ